ncbi:MAG: hypothetical protein WA623_14105, partial [Candidatus Sulfotelmatobacter sp.]
LITVCTVSTPCEEVTGSKRPLTVRDLIELTYIVNAASSTTPGTPDERPPATPIYSPDGKQFLLVTQQGDLLNNRLVGTIWVFDSQTVRDYISNPSTAQPVPRKLAVMSAPSNTPVISDVHWIQGSGKVAFLGKDVGGYQRLFQVDVETGLLKAVTEDGSYVTAYEMKGATTVYTVLALPQGTGFDRDMVPMGQKTINDLLYPEPPSLRDLTSTQLAQYPSSLHVQRDGKEVPIDFREDGAPVQFFIPTLSLSYDGEHLVTVAAVENVPQPWEQYLPNGEWFRLKAGPVEKKRTLTWGSMERPEQYVIADLTTGSVKPLVEAPVGRDMGHYIPTQAWWLEDNRRVVLTNTYLPFSAHPHETNASQSPDGPAIAVVDTSTGKILASVALRESMFGTRPYYAVKDITWDSVAKLAG